MVQTYSILRFISACQARAQTDGSVGPTFRNSKNSGSIGSGQRATDPAKRKQLAGEIQKLALSEVTYVPWGEWVQPTVFRKNVRGILKFGAPIFWNVKLA